MNKNTWLILAAVSFLLLIGGAFFFTGRQSQTPAPASTDLITPFPSESADNIITPAINESATITIMPTMNPSNTPKAFSVTELKIEDEVSGTGDEAVSGKSVTVNYRGTLTNGTEFDSSYKRNQPFTFNLGAGQVIQGWEQGVAGMKVGGKRKLTIPPSLGYGSRDMGTIPPNSTLVFEIELLKVE